MVLYDRINFDLPVDKIGVDDKGSIEEAVRLLHENGVEKIGLVSAIQNLDVGVQRLEGYRDAVRDLDLKGYIASHEEVESLRQRIKELLQAGVKGIISTDIVGTLLSSRVAFEEGLKIPEDLKLIGYVNEDVAPFLSPSLSYIDQHPRKIGEAAINFLYDRINSNGKKADPVKQVLKTEMIHLDSTRF